MSARDRLARIELWLGPPLSDDVEPQVIRIGGGVAGEEFMHATAGRLYFRRGLHEAQEDFEERVWFAAIEAREPVLVIGGLPPAGPDDLDQPAEEEFPPGQC
jgi:hypothetical protein